MATDILTLARETLALADLADLTPLKVNRHDTIAGAIGWQLQQDGGEAEVVGELIDLDIPKAKGTAYHLANAHAAAPELARVIALLDKLTSDEIAGVREQWEQGRPDPEAIGWGDAMVFIRQRLGLDTTEGGAAALKARKETD